MKISTRGRYGLRVMLELALRHGNRPIMMSTIAACQGISRKYLHSLLTSLKAAGLVRSVRGAGGGYVLAHEPSEIQVGQVVEALEGSITPVECVVESSVCQRSDFCAARIVWSKMSDAMMEVLFGISLQRLADWQMEKGGQQLTYHI